MRQVVFRIVLLSTLVFSGINVAAEARPASPPWKFAGAFEPSRLLESPETATDFRNTYIRWEANFFNIIRDPQSGLIYDGINLDPTTGLPSWFRYWSAPSKECLDIGVLTKIIQKHEPLWRLTGAATPEQAQIQAIRLLQKKLKSYRRFHRDFPGLGGFMPWYGIIDRPGLRCPRVAPINDWQQGTIGDLPALDNGEWAWALLTLEHVLRREGITELAKAFREFNQLQVKNATRLFWDAKRELVRDARVHDVYSADGAVSLAPRMGYLTGNHGVHEGAMILAYMSLFAEDLPENAAARMWREVAMKRIDTPWGPTWQGYWGSAHEEWAYLFLPLLEIPEFARLFHLRQVIRTNHAVQHGRAGLAASVIAPDTDAYYSDCGIEGINTQPITHPHTFALYGVFPVLLDECRAPHNPGRIGLAWLHNTLSAPKMQGPLGGGESVPATGAIRFPVKTVDGTFPVLLALAGGVGPETAEMLQKQRKWESFCRLFQDQYEASFGEALLDSPHSLVPPQQRLSAHGGPEYYDPASATPFPSTSPHQEDR